MYNKIKNLTFCILALCTFSEMYGQANINLKFNPSGIFRIIQFTDLHFQYNSVRSDSVLTFMRSILATEKPDLVVLTGDVVTSKGSIREGWLAVTKVMIDAKIPYAVTLGNHDIQNELTGSQIFDILEKLPYNMSERGPASVKGSGNYILKITGSKEKTTQALIYCFDSGEHPVQKEWGSYDWIRFNQVQWYREQSTKIQKKNNGRIIPALAFFHIPFPEFNEIRHDSTTIGRMEETVCSPDINSGLFASMVERKDIMGVFVGHDHNSNYSGTRFGICLTYGCTTGKQCYGKIEKGARIIELTEGQRSFKTWIYTYNNENKYPVTYPDSFVKKH
jgi:hypothetical protein